MTTKNGKMNREKLIDALNEDLSREYQAIISYVNYSQVLKGAAYMNIADELAVHATEELSHALQVANHIDYLGGMPSVTPKPVKTSEKAEDMLYIVSGRFKLIESGIELPVGAIVGELGMLSPSNTRTQSLECVEAGRILSVSYSKVEELYVQNPAFGFYFLRLSSARLFQNIDTLEQRLARLTAAPVAAEPKPA